MKFHIPFTFSPLDKLRKKSANIRNKIHRKKNSRLTEYLKSADSGLTREEYLAICIRSAMWNIGGFILFLTTTLFILGVSSFILYGVSIAILFTGFIFAIQIIYPKVYVNRKERDVERNLIPALEDMLVQFNSGVPMFSVLVNISSSNYGELSSEFKKVVKKINAGLPQAETLEEAGERNSSIFFRRALWQLSNGMRAGSDISVVIKDTIKSLNEEQLIQIQNYGNKLNPMIMFYMIISVILPALSVTFLTIISSMVALPEQATTLLFVALFFFVVFIQVVFIGVIKSLRPSLL